MCHELWCEVMGSQQMCMWILRAEHAFFQWRRHPHALVGFHPRLAEGSPLQYTPEHNVVTRQVPAACVAPLHGQILVLRFTGAQVEAACMLLVKLTHAGAVQESVQHRIDGVSIHGPQAVFSNVPTSSGRRSTGR